MGPFCIVESEMLLWFYTFMVVFALKNIQWFSCLVLSSFGGKSSLSFACLQSDVFLSGQYSIWDD